MKRLATLTALLAALTVSSAGATPTPHCHWTHARVHGVNIYTQVCTVQKHKRHPVNPRWTHAGPGNSGPVRIG